VVVAVVGVGKAIKRAIEETASVHPTSGDAPSIVHHNGDDLLLCARSTASTQLGVRGEDLA
jgi:hypothetical protein